MSRPGGRAPYAGPYASQGQGGDQHRGFDEIVGHTTDLLVRKRFNATPIVLLLVVVAVVIGLYWAWNALTSTGPGLSDLLGDSDGAVATPLPSEATDDPTDAAGDGDGTDTASPEATDDTAPTVAPVIAGAEQVDPPPDGDNNEHPELVADAIDGDEGTRWISRTYQSPTYGMKQGIGFAVELEQEATVSAVVVRTSVTGGNVEIRATTADQPTEGTVLASGAFDGDTVFELSEPVEASSLVLWFTELPQTTDGRNRMEINEIEVR